MQTKPLSLSHDAFCICLPSCLAVLIVALAIGLVLLVLLILLNLLCAALKPSILMLFFQKK